MMRDGFQSVGADLMILSFVLTLMGCVRCVASSRDVWLCRLLVERMGVGAGNNTLFGINLWLVWDNHDSEEWRS
jgi:hypothetical protein